MLIPLSEDGRLVLDAPKHLFLAPGESADWDEVTVMSPGERRVISLEINVAEGAHGRMVRVFDVPRGARLTIFHKVRVEARAHWQSAVCVRGQGEVIVRRTTELCGPEAAAEIICVGMLTGQGLISAADEVFVHALKTRSRLQTKIVLNEAAKSESRGRMVVHKESGQSQAYERLDHLVFGDQARAVVIPELEVQTDDVQCGHGATTSRPGDGEVFYLMSRGLSKDASEQLLAKGFMAQALAGLPEPLVHETLKMLVR
jgi:Fe-S cluster assembly protein SufD